MLSLFFIVCCICWWGTAASWDYPAPRDGPYLSTYDSQVKPNSTLPPDGSFLSGVLSALTVTAVSEVGDKTFFIALVLALTHPPAIVYAGALTALAFMTILSASLGLVFSYLSSLWVHYLSALLFLLFGLKMLKDGLTMSNNAAKEELEEVQKTVETKITHKGSLDLESGMRRLSVRWVFVESFTMTFVSEWGDRSQIATVILAAKHSVMGVVLGSILGHAACTLGAVLGGKLIADWISVRTVTLLGGILFLAFAFMSLVGALNDSFENINS
ncbi:GDT1-like protein sll0615 [Argiope bruennichi]|uniref:GDT1 family protein n=1 Tax=Argiope bruennichi TaxID=94029 RepID=A0A8T0F8I1_ARGBR|nr:GDT1-like protein sll0615 [Argiope bruennichi]XP_055942215.1 GDT1-like protein sll0615 [Argiope bruennichi]KAF8786525.1 Transmembrane protein 165 like protein [Argiope bruennichi]